VTLCLYGKIGRAWLSGPAGFIGVTVRCCSRICGVWGIPEKVAVWQGSKNQEEERNIPAVQRRAAVGVFLFYPYLRSKRFAARQIRGHSFQKAWKRGQAQQGEEGISGSLSLQHKK